MIYKIKLLLMVLLLFSCQSRGMKTKSIESVALYITVNPMDCLNCTAILYNLKQMDIDYSFLVASEKDKKLLTKALRLTENESDFKVDNALLNKLQNDNLSRVFIVKKDQLIKSVPIKEIDNILPYYIALKRNIKTKKEFQLPENLECSKSIVFNVFGDNLYILDEFTSDLHILTMNEDEIELESSIDIESLEIQDLYKAKKQDTFGLAAFKQGVAFAKTVQPNSIKFLNISTNESGAFVSIELRIPQKKSKDSLVLELNFFIGQVLDGRIQNIKWIPKSINNRSYPGLQSGFYANSESISTYYISKPLWQNSSKECHHFLVNYHVSDSGLYNSKKIDVCLPNYWHEQELDKLDNFTFSNSIGHFVHFPWFALYNSDTVKVVEIDEIAINYKGVKGFPPEKGIIITNAMQKNDILLTTFYNQEESAYKELIYDLKNNKVLSITKLASYPEFTFNGQLKYQPYIGYLMGINLDKNLLYRF